MRKILPLNEGDTIQIREGFVKDKIGTVGDPSRNENNKIFIRFPDGWCGWHTRRNLRILKRLKK